MANKGLTYNVVRELGLELPRAEEDLYYRMPALKVDGEIFVVQTGHRSAEPDSISLPIGFERRTQLIASDPDVFYVKPHYEAYPVVLVRLDRIERETLRRLLRSAYRAVSSGAVKAARPATAPPAMTRW